MGSMADEYMQHQPWCECVVCWPDRMNPEESAMSEQQSAELDAATQEEREALDRASHVLGWQHLARYSGMSTDWLNLTLLAIVRSARAAHTCVTSPGLPDPAQRPEAGR